MCAPDCGSEAGACDAYEVCDAAGSCSSCVSEPGSDAACICRVGSCVPATWPDGDTVTIRSRASSPIGLFKSSLAGNGGPQLETAAKRLVPALDASDWFYLANAVWPSDLSTALADPRLQKAMVALGSTAPRSSLGSQALDRGPGLHTLAAGGTPVPVNAAFYQQARALTLQVNGVAILAKPGVVVAFSLALQMTTTTALPAPGAAADPTTDTQTLEFFKDGREPTLTSTGTPPCCNGTLVFPQGTFSCSDATSCKGQGYPPKSRFDTSSSPPTTGGTKPPASGASCAQGWSATCCQQGQYASTAQMAQSMGLGLVCTADNACYSYSNLCCSGQQYDWICLGNATTLLPGCTMADPSCSQGQDRVCCPFSSYP